MNGPPTKSQVSALLVTIARYKDPAYESLNEAPKATRALAEVLARGGYTHVRPELLEGGDNASIASTLDVWLCTADKGDTVVLYWAGHGKSNAEGFYLVTKNSPSGPKVTGLNALEASVLGSALAKSPAEKVLVLLDTCYSGAGARDIAQKVATALGTRPEQPGRCPAFAVIASAHALNKAQEAVFCKGLTGLLSQPYAKERSWTDNDQFISQEQLAKALWQRVDKRPYWKAEGLGRVSFPIPATRANCPPRTWRLGGGAWRRRSISCPPLAASR
jgi:hypothetical protein